MSHPVAGSKFDIETLVDPYYIRPLKKGGGEPVVCGSSPSKTSGPVHGGVRLARHPTQDDREPHNSAIEQLIFALCIQGG
jgi:hypothetical protein